MQISPVNFYNYKAPSFEGRGKPIDLKYVVENRASLLPARVLEAAREYLRRGSQKSLRDIHMEIYAPLLAYTSFEAVKEDYPEFKYMSDSVTYSRNSIYQKEFKERTAGKDFPLLMLQKLWGELKTKDEVAQELGMKSRSSIDWALKQIDFVYFPKNYRVLLKASDEEGQRQMAQSTTDRNAQNPELMYERNRHAAQFCKTPEYRAAQSKRILEHDKAHPERRRKISEANRIAWSLCPEVRDALSLFAAGESTYCRGVMKKKTLGEELSACEKRAVGGFYKRFWAAHPELKEIFAKAKKGAKGEGRI